MVISLNVEYSGGPLDGLISEIPTVDDIQRIAIHAGKLLEEGLWFTSYDSDWYDYTYDEYKNKFVYDETMNKGHKELDKLFNMPVSEDYVRPQKATCNLCEKKCPPSIMKLGYCSKCVVELYRTGGLVDK